MRKKEQLLWDSFKRNAPSELWLQRVENVMGVGMPDVYVGCSGLWVELKAPTSVPKREATRVLGGEGLNQDQINWHMKMASYNMFTRNASYILVRTCDHELFLIPGGLADTVNEMPMFSLRKCRVANDWAAIMEVLR